jgi:hypothetical protein
VYTEPKCDWYDGCSLYERGLIEEDERRKNEELKALIKQIRQERAVEEAKIAVVEEVCIIFNVCIACFICRWRVVMTVLTHNIKKKSGKAGGYSSWRRAARPGGDAVQGQQCNGPIWRLRAATKGTRQAPGS